MTVAEDIAEILAALRNSDWRDKAWPVVDSWGDEPVEAHLALCAALIDRMRTDRSRQNDYYDRRRGSFNEADMFDSLVYWVGIQPGQEAAAILIDVCHHLAARRSNRTLRNVVAAMPRTHPVPEILEVFHRQDHREPQESWTVILHEYIASGADLSADEAVTSYLGRVHAIGHPLGLLPAKLLVQEDPDTPTPDHAPLYPTVPASIRRGVDTRFATAHVHTAPWDRRALLEPFRCWLEVDMNARADGAVVYFDRQVLASHIDGDSLGRLSIECMSGPQAPTAWRVSASEACQLLQSQAAAGGCYGEGQGEAYGRLAMWRCIAALAGQERLLQSMPEDVPPDAVQTIIQAAEECAWWRFHKTWWFSPPEHVSPFWNTGFAVLRPSGRSMAITACSDTD